MVIFPIVVAENNIIYTYDYGIFSLNTITNEIKVLANDGDKIQFLKNGYDYYLRVLNNPKDIGNYSRTNDFHLNSKYIDLQTLSYTTIPKKVLDKMHVRSIKWFGSQGLEMAIYNSRDVAQYFRNHAEASKVGFLF